MPQIRYGDKVTIRDRSRLDGIVGQVIKVCNKELSAQVLLDREVIWVVRLEDIEPAP